MLDKDGNEYEVTFINTSGDYTIYSDFSIKKHKQKFINYLEVIIHEDGSVHYAIPSHQEYMIRYACRKLSCSKQHLFDMCPEEYYFDYMRWLCMITGCVAVWSNNVLYHTLTEQQKDTLRTLVKEELTVMNLEELNKQESQKEIVPKEPLKSFEGLKNGDLLISLIDKEVTGFYIDYMGEKYLSSKGCIYPYAQFTPEDFYIYDGNKAIGEKDMEFFENL